MIKERQAQLDALYHRLASPDPVLQTQMHESTMAHSLEDKELVEKASTAKSGAYFRALYFEGDLSRYGGDHSRADLALMGMLAFWSGKDAEQMERLFTESALGQRDKWRNRLDYRERTIRKAIEGCYDTYKGRPQANLEVQHKIRRLEEVAAGLPWDDRNGARNRYVLDAFLYTGGVWGVPHPEGVVVGTSIRHLALEAGIGSVDSVQAAIRELHEWVEVVKRGRDATTPNTYLIKDRANPVQSLTPKPVKTTVPELRALLRRVRQNSPYQPPGEKKVRSRDGNRIVTHVVRTEGNLPVVSGSVGKKAALVLEKVVLAGGHATLEELARMLNHSRPRDLRRGEVTRLLEAGLLLEDGRDLYIPEDLKERLIRHLEDTGTLNAERRQRERYEAERLHRQRIRPEKEAAA